MVYSRVVGFPEASEDLPDLALDAEEAGETATMRRARPDGLRSNRAETGGDPPLISKGALKRSLDI